MWFAIDFSSHVPVYQQIKERIKSLIKSGKLQRGQFVPSIRSLAEDIQVNINTVARAYRELVNEGVLEPVRGEGYIVGRLNEEDFMNQMIDQFERSILQCKRVGIDLEVLKEKLEEVYRRDENDTES
ncbi:MAG TPA: GntR family transcriptional regulator [Pseudothermotoga sp.]|mgnify:CR=1 FL=1|nr:GntR family transcriptional regulator [Pseudothermotoga sp.]HOK84344.1 GntR family transcriptional regulator [Pseudothermotoga sp.]HPP70756.1 GntR family transcriptional regulator [Pseudothermotoga sp.]